MPSANPFKPYEAPWVTVTGEALRYAVISTFPGSDEKAKLNAIFKSAPAWLLHHTFGDYTAAVLGLETPDLSKVFHFARSREVFDRWWGLPTGAFERSPWPNGPEREPLARTDLSLLRPEPAHDESMTRRERRRAAANSIQWSDEWPALYPLEFIQKDIRSALAELGTPGFVPEIRHPEFCGEMSLKARVRGR